MRQQNPQRCRQLSTSAVLLHTNNPQNAKDPYEVNPARKPDLELGVGELEGISFKVEPLRRKNEDTSTMRARLLCMFAP